nr:MAG TPA: hypothetical protein [Caudoviricetes sp.]
MFISISSTFSVWLIHLFCTHYIINTLQRK